MIETKSSLFSKVITYPTNRKIELSTLFNQWQGKEYGQVRLWKVISKDYLIYKYRMSSRAGEIYIHLKKQNDGLQISIKERITGFLLPLIFALLSIYGFIRGVNELGWYSFLTSILLFFLILGAFHYHSRKIQLIIDKIIQNL